MALFEVAAVGVDVVEGNNYSAGGMLCPYVCLYNSSLHIATCEREMYICAPTQFFNQSVCMICYTGLVLSFFCFVQFVMPRDYNYML